MLFRFAWLELVCHLQIELATVTCGSKAGAFRVLNKMGRIPTTQNKYETFITSLFHQHTQLYHYLPDMFRRICAILKGYLANTSFKTQFGSQMYLIKCFVYTMKWLHKIVTILQVPIKDDSSRLYLSSSRENAVCYSWRFVALYSNIPLK